MRKKHNLKQRMLIREKKLKFISKIKRMTCLSTVALMALSIINPQILAYATSNKSTNQLLKTQVEYNEDYSKANIKFDVNSIDKEKYEIISITSDSDGKNIYDKKEVTEENKEIKYETIENGSYNFTVKYVEKQKKEVQAIDENVKETKSKVISDEVNKETEVAIDSGENIKKHEQEKAKVENNEGIEKQEEKASENTMVIEEEKEERIVVDISKIKKVEAEANTSPNKPAEINDNSNENIEATCKSENTVSDNKIEKISGNIGNEFKNIDESVNLVNQFNLSGVKANRENTVFERIDSSYYQVNPQNKLIIGKNDTTYVRQSIALTSKYSIDFNKNFKISGQVNISSLPEGFAIGFHTNPNYINRNTGGSLGVYKDNGDLSSKNQGISNGIVLEVDNFNNSALGDDYKNYPIGENGKHLGINYTDDIGQITNVKNEYNISNIFDKNVAFNIIWDASTNIIRFDIGSETISAEVKSKADLLKKSEVYCTISTVLCLKDDRYNDKNVLSFDSFKYSNIDPSISTMIKSKEDGYINAGETISIIHEIKNKKQTVQLEDKLHLGKIKINNTGNDLEISNVKLGTSLDALEKGGIFDKNHPLKVIYPENSKSFYVQYDIRVPDLEENGEAKQLNYEILLGQEGMSQVITKGNLLIKTDPSFVKPSVDIDLKGNFYVSSWKGSVNSNDPSIDLSNEVNATIDGNKLRLTTPEAFDKVKDNYYYQSTSLTYKGTVNLKNYFIIEGTVNIDDYPDELAGANGGFAIAFHKEREYRYGGGYSGNLGLYNTRQKNGLDSPAIIIETDGYDNYGDDQGPLGDTEKYQEGAHLAIQTYKNKSSNPVVLKKTHIGNNKNLVGANDFKLEWIPLNENNVTLKYSYGNYSIEVLNLDVKSIFGDDLRDVTFTLAGAGGTGAGGLPDGTKVNGYCSPIQYNFTLKGIKTDIEPEITTEYSTQHDFSYLGEAFGVRHKVTNKRNSPYDSEVSLYLEDFSVYDKDNPSDETGKIKLNINGKIQYSYTGGQSDSEWIDFEDQESLKNGQPLRVTLPKNQKPIYIRYNAELPKNIRNPEYKDDGASYEIKNIVLAGEKGMSQSRFDFRANIITKPAIWSEKEGALNKKIGNEVIKVSNKSEITKENMWKGIKAKASHHDVKSLDNEYSTKAVVPNVEIRDYSYFTENSDGVKTEHGKVFPVISDDVMFYGLTITVGVENLTNTFTTRLHLDDLPIQDNLIINATGLEVSETKLNTMDKSTFENYVVDNSKAIAFKLDSNGVLTKLDRSSLSVNSDGWINELDYAYKKPGSYQIEISAKDQGKIVNKNINLNVIENTWSYDTEDRTEANGASGFIVIPKGINMESGSGKDKDKIEGKGKVFFANYPNSIDVKYNIYIDKTFDLIKTDDITNKINVTTSSTDADKDYDVGDNNIRISNVGYRWNESNPIRLNFKASKEKIDNTKTKGRWKGNVTFYFERLN